MALTANQERKKSAGELFASEVINTEVLYSGGYVALGAPDHGTTANRGRLFAWASAAGEIPVGFAYGRDITGDTSASPIPAGTVDAGETVIKQVAVTGLAGTVADVGQKVYMSDDGTFTFTRPTVGIPIGIVSRWISASLADVKFFSMNELLVLAMAGCGQQLMYLGHFDVDTIANGNLRTGIPMPFHGKFLTVFAMVDKAVTGSGTATAAINLEIGGTNVTGGVITVTAALAGTKGAKLAGSSVTAANVFHEGDLLDVEAASVIDLTGGTLDIYAEVELLPGI